MESAFSEIQRVLKPNAWATVVFQSSDAEVWAALRTAAEHAGFDLSERQLPRQDTAVTQGLQGSVGQ